MKVKIGIITWCYLLLMLINYNKDSYFVSAKSLDITQQNCHKHVGEFFESFLNIVIVPSEKLGDICGGHCCSSQTEADIVKKSVKSFEGLIRHQLKSLKGLWEATHNIYKDHVLDLSRQSENKTLSVYRRMNFSNSLLSQEPILELYKNIRSYIISEKPSNRELNSSSSSSIILNSDELEAVIEKFFRNLFPLAYHHAVHSVSNEEELQEGARDFHIDYKQCLINSYETLRPFGEIPYSISRSLVQSVTSASTLLRALERGSEVLNEIANLPIEPSLSVVCQHALLKMNYCAACNGHSYHHLKPCYGYCSNVMRGCLTQLMGGIDTDWASFSEATERLMTFVRNKDGIESVIKNLDGKLSEAIMYAMTNGPDLQKKVHKSCGRLNEKLSQQEQHTSDEVDDDSTGPSLEKKQIHHNGGNSNKWSPPPDTEMLQFLSVLDRSKSLVFQIATSYCEDDRYQKQDRNCWNGDVLGDYTHKIMDLHSQKYNPEVPIEKDAPTSDTVLHKINDQLVTMKNLVNKQMTHLSRSDNDKMFSDMAENGSGDYPSRAEYDDDEDYDDDFSGSGEKSAGPTIIEEPSTPVHIPKAPNPNAGSSLRISLSTLFTVLLPSYVVILFKF